MPEYSRFSIAFARVSMVFFTLGEGELPPPPPPPPLSCMPMEAGGRRGHGLN